MFACLLGTLLLLEKHCNCQDGVKCMDGSGCRQLPGYPHKAYLAISVRWWWISRGKQLETANLQPNRAGGGRINTGLSG